MPCFFLRLAALLTEDCQPGLPNEPESLDLWALMRLHDSRCDALVNAAGDLVLLEEQDRPLWRLQQVVPWVERAYRCRDNNL